MEQHDEAGKKHAAKSRSADETLVANARLGIGLPMRYDPSRPERARIDGTRISPYGGFVAVPLFFALAGAAALVTALARGLSRRRVLVHGALAPGRVVDVSVSESPLRRRRVYDVRSRFGAGHAP